MGNAIFRGLPAQKPLRRFSKKCMVDYVGDPTQHASMGSIGSKGTRLRMREIVTLRRLFFSFLMVNKPTPRYARCRLALVYYRRYAAPLACWRTLGRAAYAASVCPLM